MIKNQNKEIGTKIDSVRKGITIRVRKKNKLNELLRIIKALKLMQATSKNLKENHENYDHLKIVTLIKGADNVFEKTLKDVKIMVNVRNELELYKTTSYDNFKNHFYNVFEAYYSFLNDQTLEMLQNIDENDAYGYFTEFDEKDPETGSLLNTPHRQSDADIDELLKIDLSSEKKVNKYKKEDFERNLTKEKVIVETLLEMQRLQKFDVSRLVESIEEKIKENNQNIKTFLVGGIAEIGRHRNLKCLEIFFKYAKEANTVLVEIIHQVVKQSTDFKNTNSTKVIGKLQGFYEDLYETVVEQNKILLKNLEKILHSFIQEGMGISEIINTAKILDNYKINFMTDFYGEIFLRVSDEVFNQYIELKTKIMQVQIQPIDQEIRSCWISGFYGQAKNEIDRLTQEENWLPGEIDSFTVIRMNKMLKWNRKEEIKDMRNNFMGFKRDIEFDGKRYAISSSLRRIINIMYEFHYLIFEIGMRNFEVYDKMIEIILFYIKILLE